jgi:hypothetical protein
MRNPLVIRINLGHFYEIALSVSKDFKTQIERYRDQKARDLSQDPPRPQASTLLGRSCKYVVACLSFARLLK